MKKGLFIFLCVCISCMMGSAQITFTNPKTDQKAMEQFLNKKLGLFIHWEVCGTPEKGGFWSIGNGTPKSVTDSITFQWNPVKFDAKEYVNTAIRLGCKYMVVVAKHLDGFCIWDSKYSHFDLEKVAYKNDILKGLSDECHRRGLLFGIHFSIADIDYAGWEKMPTAWKPFPEPKRGNEDYVKMVRNQVTELISNYNPDIFWCDACWLDPLWAYKDGIDLYNMMQSLKPSILSTRLSETKGFNNDGTSGDFFSLPVKRLDEKTNFPWETFVAVTHPEISYDPKATLLSKSELLTLFHKAICRNGNFLLSIPPMRSGELPKEQVERFAEMTSWINDNKEAVYDTKGGPFALGDWGGSTYSKNHIYLHLQDKPKEIRIKTLNGYKVMSAIDLKTKQKVKTDQIDGQVIVYLPEFEKGREFPVIELTLNKDFKFTQWMGFEPSK